MDTFEEFKRNLQNALAHLYDPTYWPPEMLWVVSGCVPQQGVEAVQAVIIQAIERLKPAPDVPPTACSRRIYEILSYRYIQNLTQKETAERLNITPRHLRREQQKAVNVLARRLWEQSHIEPPLADYLKRGKEAHPPETTPLEAKSLSWRSQVRKELASLQKSAPGTMADVGETIRGVVEIESTLTSRHGVSLEVEVLEPNLVAAIHPSALRQILITAIGKLVQNMSSGQIALRAEREEGQIKITITGCPAEAYRPLDGNLIQEILTTQGGSVQIGIDDDRISFQVELPSGEEITILIVDDNLDLVHFYRRYTAGTRYHIVHAAHGQRVFETIETCAPDIIVLDVMLPDVDGWELLAHLREHPATRSIPVIVCSVIRERELALALGATLYLPKPVRRQQFIQALEQALSQASAKGPRVQANNAATC